MGFALLKQTNWILRLISSGFNTKKVRIRNAVHQIRSHAIDYYSTKWTVHQQSVERIKLLKNDFHIKGKHYNGYFFQINVT